MLSGNANELMTVKAHLLTSISISTVFMGAMTYIGNAPNLMIKSIAANYGVKAPSFIGYLAWSIGILIPVFFIISCIL
jgi:Na+/H+ antiporter NhaD/arsenite permease-like protein